MANCNTWVQSELDFLKEIIFFVDDEIKPESKWEAICQAMISEQPKHQLGGELFEQDPWPERVFTPHGIFFQWLEKLREDLTTKTRGEDAQ